MAEVGYVVIQSEWLTNPVTGPNACGSWKDGGRHRENPEKAKVTESLCCVSLQKMLFNW